VFIKSLDFTRVLPRVPYTVIVRHAPAEMQEKPPGISPYEVGMRIVDVTAENILISI
jgi:hypothetical protein